MNKSLPYKYIAEIMLLIVAILWSATFVVNKSAINDISAMTLLVLRFMISAIILLPFISLNNLTKIDVKTGLLLGVLLFLEFALQIIGLKYTTATKSGFLTGTAIVMVPFLQVFISRKRPNVGNIIGVLIISFGLLIMTSDGTTFFSAITNVGSNFNIGDLLTLISAFFFGLYIIYLDLLAVKCDFWSLLFLQFLFTGLLATFFMFVEWSFKVDPFGINMTWNLGFAIVYTSIFATLISTALQTRFQKYVTPTKAIIIFSLEPIFSAGFARVFINEELSSPGYLGAGLVIAGLLCSELYLWSTKKYS